jgi:hypothetical protein
VYSLYINQGASNELVNKVPFASHETFVYKTISRLRESQALFDSINFDKFIAARIVGESN